MNPKENNARVSSQDFIKKLLIAERQKTSKGIFEEIETQFIKCSRHPLSAIERLHWQMILLKKNT